MGGGKNVNPLTKLRNLERLTSLNEDVNVGQGSIFGESGRSKGRSTQTFGAPDEK